MNDEREQMPDPDGEERVASAAQREADGDGSFLIVGIGASAGGIEALREFLGAVPADSGMAFVIVQHLAPDRASGSVEIFARVARIPVLEIEEGASIEPDHVYVIPPDRELTVERARLRLRRPDGKRPLHPIDIFFESLAREYGTRAVAIVMSGFGDDGSRGLTAIREHGGLALAQGTDSTAPKAEDMPRNAAATGLVDFILPSQVMPAHLKEHARHVVQLASIGQMPVTADLNGHIDTICRLLNARVGHDFRNYKRRTLSRRIQRRMQVQRIEAVETYVERCRVTPVELDRLFQDLLIGVTQFFRDPAGFTALEQEVIPAIFRDRDPDEPVRIWVPGCATGEEAYSIAIIVREYQAKLPEPPRVQIFATDIDERSLQSARSGRYGREIAAHVSPERLERFFYEEGSSYRLTAEVRELCIFSTHNVVANPPYSRLDLVSCRNLLIYLDAELQAQLIPVLHYAVRPGGFMFLGPSENISRHADLFDIVSKRHRIFRRRETGRRMFLTLPRSSEVGRPAQPRSYQPPVQERSIGERAERAVLERHAPPFVIVNESQEVVHFSSRTGRFLEAPSGAPERDILALARRGLRLVLRDVLTRVIATGQPAEGKQARVETDAGSQMVEVTAQPLARPDAGAKLVLIVFNAVGAAGEAQPAGDGPMETDVHFQQLEAELQATREMLQTSLEEYETSSEELRSSNEELVSINEELQSSNEEFESSKEEAQSLNEELQTVNNELQNKIEELNRTNADLSNLIDSSAIATLFLDDNLVIRNFTPTATRIFRVIASDLGRPIADIVHRLEALPLEEEMRAVLRTGLPAEREVSLRDEDATYLMRIGPYLDSVPHPTGIVLTFIDVTRLKLAERQRGLLLEELNHRVKNILAVVMSIASHMLRDFKSPEEFRPAYLGRLEALAAANALLAGTSWQGASLGEIVTLELRPYVDEHAAHIGIEGPAILLAPRAALTLGLAFHELVTNAAKYGALARPGMRLNVSWRHERSVDAARLVIVWEESGGEGIGPPASEGFGSTLVRKALAYDLGGEVEMAFRDEGLRCILSLPAADVIAAPEGTNAKRGRRATSTTHPAG